MPDAEASGQPLDANELEQLFSPLGAFQHVALGVSGGADSTALLRLAETWRASVPGRPRVSVLTVDHGLRPEAADEARTVAAVARDHGLFHATLDWTGPKPSSGLQAAARDARLELLCGWCRDNGAEALALAHTANDQAETLLMRLMRGSGVDGLTGMQTVSRRDGVVLVRPLLGVRRERLELTLRHMGQAWIEDPSNRDDRFERIRVRRLLEQLDGEGDGIDGICRTAARMADVRSTLDVLTDRLVAEAVAVSRYGYCEIDRARYRRADPEIARRLANRVLMAVSGQIYPVPRDGVMDLHGRLVGEDDVRHTLGLCCVEARGDTIRIVRESGPRSPASAAFGQGGTVRWDNRFVLEIPHHIGPGSVGALEREGWAHVCEAVPELAGLPERVRHALPCLRTDDGGLYMPHAADSADIGGGVRVSYDDRGLLSGAADRDRQGA